MIRKTLTILSLIGLLLSLGLWGASYFNFRMYWGKNYVDLVLGKLSWSHSEPNINPFGWYCEGFQGFYLRGLKPPPPKYWGYRRAGPATPWNGPEGKLALPGITALWYPSSNPIGAWDSIVSILLWVPTLLFGITCSCLSRPLHHRRRRKRKKLGLCVKCGYDLRGSQERCPECGTGFSS